MQRGYLNLAYEVVANRVPKEYEVHIKDRIESMVKIKTHNEIVEKIPKKQIEKTSILFAVHNSFPYDKAGYAVRTDNIATALQNNEIKLTIATRAGYPWDLQKHREVGNNSKNDCVNGINYIRLDDKEKTFKKGADSNYISIYAEGLVKEAKKLDVTIIHGHSNYLNGLAAVEASNILMIPSVYEIRGLWHVTRLTKDPNYKYGGMYDYEQEMVTGTARASDAVITISHALKKLIVSWGINENKVHVIPNAVNISLFRPQEKNISLIQKFGLEDQFVVGFIGSLTTYEGLTELVLAVDALIIEGFNIALLIVGEGDEKVKLEKTASSKNIIFTGRVDFSDVEQYYSIFDMCAYPRNDYEVCRYVPPLKPLEAMAMKKPIVVSNMEPLLEIVQDKFNGLVCKADDVDSLKDAITALYNNKNLREELADNAYTWVTENRSWDLVAKKYVDVYNSFK